MNLETMQKISQRVMNGKGLLDREQIKHVADPLTDRYTEDDVFIRRYSDENREID